MERLSSSRVSIFGIGGVVGYTIEALIRSGVSAVDLVDDMAIGCRTHCICPPGTGKSRESSEII